MLKNILSLLLSKFYSKQENDTISHLATPTINNPVNVTLATDANSVIVAPFDGYLNIETTAEGNPTINVWEALWCNSTPISPAQAKLFVPVTKGQRIQYRITGTISQARFVRLVGGGYQDLRKLILQGGGLCLNSLSSSLRRSTCRVNGRGFNTQLVHHLRRSTSLSLKTMSGTLLCPVLTVTLRSQETPRVSFWKYPLAARGLLIAEHLREDTSFLFQKVSHSHTWCRPIQLLTRFSLSQCGLKTNSAVGGASC